MAKAKAKTDPEVTEDVVDDVIVDKAEELSDTEKADLAAAEAKIAKQHDLEAAQEKVRIETANKIELEREFRRYVRRSGGLREGITQKMAARAELLKKRLGRSDFNWDKNMEVPDAIDMTGVISSEPIKK